MSNPEQRCGTCRWFDSEGLDYGLGVSDRGWCHAPVPESVYVDYRDPMQPTEGATCPCWEAKE